MFCGRADAVHRAACAQSLQDPIRRARSSQSERFREQNEHEKNYFFEFRN